MLKQTRRRPARYFDRERPTSDELPLAPIGTPFRMAVWRELLKIPYGEVTTYGQIAITLARQRRIPKMSAQAVGGAVGHNPIGIIIPCHRVIGANVSSPATSPFYAALFGQPVTHFPVLLPLSFTKIRTSAQIFAFLTRVHLQKRIIGSTFIEMISLYEKRAVPHVGR